MDTGRCIPAVHIADTFNDRVVKRPAHGGPGTTVGTRLDSPSGVAIASDGNVHIADTGHQRVVKVAPAGSLFVNDRYNQRVIQVPPHGGPVTTVPVDGLADPGGPPLCRDGSVIVADPYNGPVCKVAPDGGPQSTVGTCLQFPTGVVTPGRDASIADFNQSRVFRVDADTGSPVTIGTGLDPLRSRPRLP
ncbi:hypothetical protein [Streptomyces sp. NPDC006879]|uniref:hypothetical protein n=1 Tax=Streptomyces sp. NPDC006879 TaxID=3364767 RepID=UPI0036C1B2D7